MNTFRGQFNVCHFNELKKQKQQFVVALNFHQMVYINYCKKLNCKAVSLACIFFKIWMNKHKCNPNNE